MVVQPFFLRPPKSAVSEVCGPLGSGKTALVVEWLAGLPASQIAWIETGLSLYPCALAARGVALERVLWLDCVSDAQALECTLEVLRAQVHSIVIVHPRTSWAGVQWRRVQLAAEKAGAWVIRLGDRLTQEGAWPIAFQVTLEGLGQVPVIHKSREPLRLPHGQLVELPCRRA